MYIIKIFLLKVIFLKNLFFFFNIKSIFYKKKFFFYKKDIFIKKLILCLDCHEGINYSLYPELYKIPLIKNQNNEYLEDSINLYKNFERKSFYMNFISKNLSSLNICYLSFFFSFENEIYKR